MISVCSPADLVIYKLVATRLRDHEDAASVVRRQASTISRTYDPGVWISVDAMANLRLMPHVTHPQWNHTIESRRVNEYETLFFCYS